MTVGELEEKDPQRREYSTFTTAAMTGEWTCCHYDEKKCLDRGLKVYYTKGCVQRRDDAVKKNQRLSL